MKVFAEQAATIPPAAYFPTRAPDFLGVSCERSRSLDAFPGGAFTAQDRDLLCGAAIALGKIGEASRPHLPSLLAIFEHAAVNTPRSTMSA